VRGDGGSQETQRLPSVSVVIPTYNRRDSLRRLVPAVLADAAATEVVVVVDGSRDGSLELLQEWAMPEPRLKPVFVPNGGVTRARQTGAERASCEVILFLDDDVVPAPGLATGHARQHLQRRRILVLGYMPTMTPVPRRPGAFATYLYASEYERRCGIYEAEPGSVLRSFWAGNFSVRREDALLVGLHSPRWQRLVPQGEGHGTRGLYHEDRDLGLRFLRAGLHGVFDRSLLAQHSHARPLRAFLLDARSQGLSRRLVHELHADIVGRLSPTAFEDELPAPVRWLVWAGTGPRAHPVVVTLLSAVIRVAGRMRLFGLETGTARLLRRIEQRFGAFAASDEV
jgi:Glycosyl transferase family 2